MTPSEAITNYSLTGLIYPFPNTVIHLSITNFKNGPGRKSELDGLVYAIPAAS